MQLFIQIFLAYVSSDVGMLDQITPRHALAWIELEATVDEIETLKRKLEFLGEFISSFL